MPATYKIAGMLSENARILVLDQSDWSTASNTNETAGSYEITDLEDSTYYVSAIKSDGTSDSYADVSPHATPAVYYDQFLGTTLDTSKWQTPYVAEGCNVTVDDAAEMNLVSGHAHNGVHLQTKTEWARSGTMTIACETYMGNWTWYSVGDVYGFTLLDSSYKTNRGSPYQNPASSANYVMYGVQAGYQPRIFTSGTSQNVLSNAGGLRGSWQQFILEINLTSGDYTVSHGSLGPASGSLGSSAMNNLGSGNIVVELSIRGYDRTGTHMYRNLEILTS